MAVDDFRPRRFEGLETAYLRHMLLHPKMTALEALLEMLGDQADGIGLQMPTID